MKWLSYIFPQKLLQDTSQYNKEIRVNLESGRYKLLVNGSRQSGVYIEKLWKNAFSIFEIEKLQKINSILVLGVGGGTVIELLHRQFPNASIKGVDIDEIIIDIGKKYFGLVKIKELEIICDDAQNYIIHSKKNSFDMVVVDLFSGRKIPDFVDSEVFIKQVKTSLKPQGVLLINYLRELEYEEKSEKLNNLLKKYFVDVKDDPIALNCFFMAR